MPTLRRPRLVPLALALVAAVAAVTLAGCVGDAPTEVQEPTAPAAAKATPAARGMAGCVETTLMTWGHDADALAGTQGSTTMHVDDRADLLIVQGASGEYVSTGWGAKLEDPAGKVVFEIQGSGVTIDGQAPRTRAALTFGVIGDFVKRLVGGEDDARTTVPVASEPAPLPTPTRAPAGVGYHRIADPLPGTYTFSWRTQGYVSDLGVTVTTMQCP